MIFAWETVALWKFTCQIRTDHSQNNYFCFHKMLFTFTSVFWLWNLKILINIYITLTNCKKILLWSLWPTQDIATHGWQNAKWWVQQIVQTLHVYRAVSDDKHWFTTFWIFIVGLSAMHWSEETFNWQTCDLLFCKSCHPVMQTLSWLFAVCKLKVFFPHSTGTEWHRWCQCYVPAC